MSTLRELITDKYGPTDLVDKLDIPIDELLDCLWDYVEDHSEVFDEDFEVNEELYD